MCVGSVGPFKEKTYKRVLKTFSKTPIAPSIRRSRLLICCDHPTQACAGVVLRREEPDPGAEPDATGSAVEARPSAADDPRL